MQKVAEIMKLSNYIRIKEGEQQIDCGETGLYLSSIGMFSHSFYVLHCRPSFVELLWPRFIYFVLKKYIGCSSIGNSWIRSQNIKRGSLSCFMYTEWLKKRLRQRGILRLSCITRWMLFLKTKLSSYILKFLYWWTFQAAELICFPSYLLIQKLSIFPT